MSQRRRLRHLERWWVGSMVLLVALAAGGMRWSRGHYRMVGRAEGAADAALYAIRLADSVWAAHLAHAEPHVARLPNGRGDTVTVVYSYAACLQPRPKTEWLP